MLSHYLQVQLYEDFAKSRAKASVEDSISEASTEEEEKPKLKATGHVFQVRFFPWILCWEILLKPALFTSMFTR